MDPKPHHTRYLSEPEKCPSSSLTSNSLTTRKKLIESNLQKDHHLPTQSKSRFSLRSSEGLSSRACQLSGLTPTSRGLNLREIRPVREFSSRLTSKSPSSLRRNSSVEAKFERKSKKPAATDRVSYLSEQFSVKKVMQLGKLTQNGDFLLCRAFVALLADVDYHIKESQNYPVEVFFDYLNSPGIVVQTIKKIPDFLIHDKIPPASFVKSLEFFNQIPEISNNPALDLLAELLQSVFMFKDLSYKPLSTQDSSRNSTRHNQTPLNSMDFSKISVVSSEFVRPASRSPVKSGVFDKSSFSLRLAGQEEFVPGENPMQTKNLLLDKFFSKMGLSQDQVTQRKTSPSKEFRGRSQDFSSDFVEIGYIKPIKENRSNSLTPKAFEAKDGNKGLSGRRDKGKNIGGVVLKKVDEQFVRILSEKMKKETLDIKKIKKANFDEYLKKKNAYISANKAKWVADTLKYLQLNEILTAFSENDCYKEEKQENLVKYLNDENHLTSLIKKSELVELKSRKVNKC